MRVTIIRPDNTVAIDGVRYRVDCSKLAAYVHAIQWDSEHKDGHIEFVNDGRGDFLPNLKIVEDTQFKFLIQAWEQAKKEEEDKIKAEQAKAAADAKAKAEGATALKHLRRGRGG